jgi:hypothetical protein
MGQIRSAIDIALEKTAHIEGDPKSADHRDLKNSGKKAAGDFLANRDPAIISSALEGKDEERRQMVVEGIVSILLASLHLPSVEADIDKANLIGKGLETALPGKGNEQLFGQVAQILGQYLRELDQLLKALEQQFLPRLRAKQQEIAKRYGQNIPIDLHQDPEYVNALSKNRQALEGKYEAVIDEVRARVREGAGITEE